MNISTTRRHYKVNMSNDKANIYEKLVFIDS